jgi:hypothetical protein
MPEILPASFFVPVAHAAARTGLTAEEIRSTALYYHPGWPCFEDPPIRHITSRHSGEMLVDLEGVELLAGGLEDSGLLNRNHPECSSPF